MRTKHERLWVRLNRLLFGSARSADDPTGLLAAEGQVAVLSAPARLRNVPRTTPPAKSPRRPGSPIQLAVTDTGLIAYGGLENREAHPMKVMHIDYERIKTVSAHNLELRHALLRAPFAWMEKSTQKDDAPVPTIVLTAEDQAVAIALNASSARRVLNEIRERRDDLSFPLTWEEGRSAAVVRTVGGAILVLLMISLIVLSIIGVIHLPAGG